ncbi:MAG: peroxidase [Gammaproteobacteria bacterium]|nr:peroxidase [Gammaproteobacteria bacterium]
MSYSLDLHDIQGNIVFGYGHFGYPKGRYIFFKFNDDVKSREFVGKLVPLVTTSAPLDKQQKILEKPLVTTNIAFTYAGLRELGTPDASLRTFPEDFRMGMKSRLAILGDNGVSAPEHWDPIWRDNNWDIHMWMSINGNTEANVEIRYQRIIRILDEINGDAEEAGIEVLIGHRGPNGQDNLPYQPVSAVYADVEVDGKTVNVPTSMEHFHYTDGISDPFFKGMSDNPDAAIGAGKPTRGDPTTAEGWQPLEPGEFLLGYRDEMYEYPVAPAPRLLSFNGSFMVYRKLHENVGAFNEYLKDTSKQIPDVDDEHQAFETLAAQFSGRWRNGAPLTTHPTWKDAQEFGKSWTDCTVKLFLNPDSYSEEERKEARVTYEELKKIRVAFKYDDDIEGSKCPMTAHARRVNPRGALEYGEKDAYGTPGALVDRRRFLRRGLPYGESPDRTSNDGDHGIIFMAVNASISRQFEFVQQQWINYGNDFKVSNDKV